MVQVSLALLVIAAGPPTDRYGDPLPDGAVARFGTARLRHADLADYALPPDGRTVLTVGHGGVRVWDLGTGRLTRQVELEDAAVAATAFRFGPGGAVVAGSGGGPDVAVWDPRTGRRLKTIATVDGPRVTALAFAPGREVVAARNWDGREVNLVGWRTGVRERLPLPARGGGGGGGRPLVGLGAAVDPPVLAFSPDGRLVAADGGGGVTVFDATDHSLVARVPRFAGGVAFSPDGTRLAGTTERPGGPALVLVDLATGRQVGEVGPLPGGPYPDVAYAPDGRTVACGGEAGGCLVEVSAGRVVHVLDGGAAGPAFTADGRRVVARDGNRLRVWDRAAGREVDPRPGDIGEPACLAVSPDGRSLGTGGRAAGRMVALWDVAGGRLTRVVRVDVTDGPLSGLAFGPDGRVVRAVGQAPLVRTWEAGTGAERPLVQLVGGGAGTQGGIPVGVDGRRTYTLSGVSVRDRGLVHALGVWDAATGIPLARHELPPGQARGLETGWAVGPSAVGYASGEVVRLVDPVTGRGRDLAGARPGGPVAFSPDGRLAAAPKGRPGRDGEVGVWEVATGREVVTVPAGPVRCLAVAPGCRALVCSTEWGVSVWDLATGAERARWAPSPRPGRWWEVSGMAPTPDGGRVVTALRDGSGLVWGVPPPGPVPPGRADPADLSSEDAGPAYRAVWRLAGQPPGVVVPLLRGWLVRPRPDPAVVRRCLADLDAPGFTAREAAEKRLAGLGPAVAPALREGLRTASSAEVRARLGRILGRFPDHALAPPALLTERGVAVLELVGTADARAVLADVAAVPYGAAAKAALERLGARAGADPDSGGR